MTRKTIMLVLIAVCICVQACTQSKSSDEIVKLRQKIEQLEQQHAAMEQKVKTTGGDHGYLNQLSQDKHLLRSRIERLKERIKFLERDPAFKIMK